MSAELAGRAAEDAAMIHDELRRALNACNCPAAELEHYVASYWTAIAGWKAGALAVVEERVLDPAVAAHTPTVRRVRVVDRATGEVCMHRDRAPVAVESLLADIWNDRRGGHGARWKPFGSPFPAAS